MTRILELVPVDADVHQAEYVAHQDELQRHQRAEGGCVRDFELQRHDGDDDSDDAVAEGFQSILTHGLSCVGRCQPGKAVIPIRHTCHRLLCEA